MYNTGVHKRRQFWNTQKFCSVSQKNGTIFSATCVFACRACAISTTSVCPPVTLVNCDHIVQCTTNISVPHERAITSSLTPTVVVGNASVRLKFALKITQPCEKRRLWQISAYNVSIVRDSERSSIMTNRKSATGFQTTYRWSAHVAPKCPKGGSKKLFVRPPDIVCPRTYILPCSVSSSFFFRRLISEVGEGTQRKSATWLEVSVIWKRISEIWNTLPPTNRGLQNHLFDDFAT